MSHLLVNVLNVLPMLRPFKIITIFICVTPIYRQKIDISNDVSFMKIIHVVSDSRPERQYIVFTPLIYILILYIYIFETHVSKKIYVQQFVMCINYGWILQCNLVVRLPLMYKSFWLQYNTLTVRKTDT